MHGSGESESAAANTKRHLFAPVPLIIVAILVLSALGGVWFDSRASISPYALHVVFLVISILVTVGVTAVFLTSSKSTKTRLIGVVAAIVAWRISIFPTVVLAGCLASWGNALTTRFSSYDYVYPVFFTSFALLIAVTIGLALAFTSGKHRVTTLVAITAGFLAGVVSFISPSDIKWAMASDIPKNLQTALIVQPVANPYPSILKNDLLNWRQRTLMHIGSITYQSLPTENAPWAISVKGSLEHLLRTNARYQSEGLLIDHYRAFSAAHPAIRHP
jgi:hypothetical protein